MQEKIGRAIGQVTRLMRRSMDERARGMGITRRQWQTLSVLKYQAGINQGRLADMLEVEAITLGRLIDRLEESEMVERRPDPSDRRAWRLHITDKGMQTLGELHPIAMANYAAVFDGISTAELEQFYAILERIRANLLPPGEPGSEVYG